MDQVELLEMVTAGIVAFFIAQPAMLDQVPQLGHIPKVFKAMSARNDSIPKVALQIVQQLSNSPVCVFIPLFVFLSLCLSVSLHLDCLPVWNFGVVVTCWSRST